MSDLDAALRRLNGALEAAEAAVGRAIDSADAARAREAELQAFADDRERLAGLLDVSAGQSEAAEAERRREADAADMERRRAMQEVGRRIDVVIGYVENVLAEAR